MTRSSTGRRGAGSAGSGGQALNAGCRTERIAVFKKTKMCKFHIMGVCTQGDGCRFAHERQQLQAAPDLSCTKLCKTLINTGACGDSACRYAHNREELRAMPDEPVPGGARGRQTLRLQEAAPAPWGPVDGPAPRPAQAAGPAPCGLLIGQPMPQWAPLGRGDAAQWAAGPGPCGPLAGQLPLQAAQPAVQAALLQIVQASQAHAAEAARLQRMAEGLQQVPGEGRYFVPNGAAALPQAAPGGMAYTAPPAQPWPRAAPGAAAAAALAPPAAPHASPAAGAPGARQESGRTESTAACSEAAEDAGRGAADEGGGPPARGAAGWAGLGEGRVTVKNTFLERVDSGDLLSASTGARPLRAVQTASGRLDVMAPEGWD